MNTDSTPQRRHYTLKVPRRSTLACFKFHIIFLFHAKHFYSNHYPWYLNRTSWYWTIQFQRLLFHHDHNSQSLVQSFPFNQAWDSQLKRNNYLIGVIDSFTQRFYGTKRGMHSSQEYKTQKDKRGTQHAFSDRLAQRNSPSSQIYVSSYPQSVMCTLHQNTGHPYVKGRVYHGTMSPTRWPRSSPPKITLVDSHIACWMGSRHWFLSWY